MESGNCHFNGPTLLIDRQNLLCRQRESRAQKILRVVIPMVPLPDEHTDLKRHFAELPAPCPHQVSAGSLVCSDQLHALIPLMPERLGPLRELLVIQLPVGLDRTNHVPALTAAEFQEAIGSIPTVEEDIDLEPGREKLLEFAQHFSSKTGFL